MKTNTHVVDVSSHRSENQHVLSNIIPLGTKMLSLVSTEAQTCAVVTKLVNCYIRECQLYCHFADFQLNFSVWETFESPNITLEQFSRTRVLKLSVTMCARLWRKLVLR